MTDNQIVNEKFLVYINDLLSTGYIADLCTQEDKDTFCNSVRGEVKQAGMVDSADNCWDFFIDKVQRITKTILMQCCHEQVLSACLVMRQMILTAINTTSSCCICVTYNLNR